MCQKGEDVSALVDCCIEWQSRYIPMINDISVAIATTDLPMLARNGFWAMAHEARTDYAMAGLMLEASIQGLSTADSTTNQTTPCGGVS